MTLEVPIDRNVAIHFCYLGHMSKLPINYNINEVDTHEVHFICNRSVVDLPQDAAL